MCWLGVCRVVSFALGCVFGCLVIWLIACWCVCLRACLCVFVVVVVYTGVPLCVCLLGVLVLATCAFVLLCVVLGCAYACDCLFNN